MIHHASHSSSLDSALDISQSTYCLASPAPCCKFDHTFVPGCGPQISSSCMTAFCTCSTDVQGCLMPFEEMQRQKLSWQLQHVTPLSATGLSGCCSTDSLSSVHSEIIEDLFCIFEQMKRRKLTSASQTTDLCNKSLQQP